MNRHISPENCPEDICICLFMSLVDLFLDSQLVRNLPVSTLQLSRLQSCLSQTGLAYQFITENGPAHKNSFNAVTPTRRVTLLYNHPSIGNHVHTIYDMTIYHGLCYVKYNSMTPSRLVNFLLPPF